MKTQGNMKAALLACENHSDKNRMKALLVLYDAGTALKKKEIIERIKKHNVGFDKNKNFRDLLCPRRGKKYAISYDEGWKITFLGGEEVKKFLKENETTLKEGSHYEWKSKVKEENAEPISEISNIKSNQVFIASWFNTEMKEPIENGIKRAVRDMGYEPFVMNEYYPTSGEDRMSSEIEKQIDKSDFIIVDVTCGRATGHRPSVHYEAGYARRGKGRVIFTAKEREDGEEHSLSFDTAQLKHVLWKDSNELYENLRIEIKKRYDQGSNPEKTSTAVKLPRQKVLLGKQTQSGKKCSMAGYWQSNSSPSLIGKFKKGDIFPKCNGKKAIWTFIEYKK